MPLETKQQPPYYQDGLTIKTYTALITQQSTDAPTVQIIQNNLGNIIWTWDDPTKIAIGTLNGAFTNATVIIQMGTDPANAVWFTGQRADNNTIRITASFDFTTFLPEADAMNNTPIQIKVYYNV